MKPRDYEISVWYYQNKLILSSHLMNIFIAFDLLMIFYLFFCFLLLYFVSKHTWDVYFSIASDISVILGVFFLLFFPFYLHLHQCYHQTNSNVSKHLTLGNIYNLNLLYTLSFKKFSEFVYFCSIKIMWKAITFYFLYSIVCFGGIPWIENHK